MAEIECVRQIEYTVPHDADVIIVDGIRVSREYFTTLNDDANEGKTFFLNSAAKKGQPPVITVTTFYIDESSKIGYS